MLIKDFNKYIYLMILLMGHNNFAQNSLDEIVFHSNGSSFSPLITIEGNAEVLWIFNDSTTSTSIHPSKDYGSKGLRINRLKVFPWSSLRGINIGYDAKDGGSDTISLITDQKVSKVENLNLVAPYLELWCSSYNMIDSLNFDNFINLKTVECYGSVTIKHVSLKNTPKLKRICLEENNLTTLDISECIVLEDVRAAINNCEEFNFSNSTEELWHICIRDNPFIKNQELFSNIEKFPSVKELYIWNTNQSGVFAMHKSTVSTIKIYAWNNYYSVLDLSGSLRNAGGWAALNFNNNIINSVNLAGCVNLGIIEIRNNQLAPDSVDKVLRQLDELGTRYRKIDLRGNSIPTDAGLLYKSNLEARGWTVYIQTGCEIIIEGNNNYISNGDSLPSKLDFTDFDSVNVNNDTTIHTFIIKNNGTTPLELFGDSSLISISGSGTKSFKVILQPSNIISIGDSTVFKIAFSPSDTGLAKAMISINHDDWDKSPFSFIIQGVGTVGNSSEYNESKENKTLDEFMLLQNYPNPFNPTTVISYQLPEASNVSLKIYDILGNEIATLVEGYKPAGMYNAEFKMNNEQYGSGIYFYQLKADNFTATKKMIMIK